MEYSPIVFLSYSTENLLPMTGIIILHTDSNQIKTICQIKINTSALEWILSDSEWIFLRENSLWIVKIHSELESEGIDLIWQMVLISFNWQDSCAQLILKDCNRDALAGMNALMFCWHWNLQSLVQNQTDHDEVSS
jgi:hypothetical protein